VGVSVQVLYTRSIPLAFDTSEIHAARGYEFMDITYQPMELLLAGEKEVLYALDEITVPSSALAMSGLTDRTEKVIDISGYLPRDVQLVDENAGSVVVTINVEKDGTKSYDVTVASIAVNNLATELQLSYKTADAIVIKLQGSDVILDSFDPNTNLSIDLKEYDTPGEYIVPVDVDIPSGCILENEVFVTVNLTQVK